MTIKKQNDPNDAALLQAFAAASDASTFNRLALALADRELAAAVPLIRAKVKRSNLYGMRGTLIYTLASFPTLPVDVVDELLPILADGAWEEAHETFLLFASHHELDVALRAALVHCQTNMHKNRDLIADLFDGIREK